MPGYGETMLRGLQGVTPAIVGQRRLQDYEQNMEFQRRLHAQQLQRQYDQSAVNQERQWRLMQNTMRHQGITEDLGRRNLEARYNALELELGRLRNEQAKGRYTPGVDAQGNPVMMDTTRNIIKPVGGGPGAPPLSPTTPQGQPNFTRTQPLNATELSGLRDNADELQQAVRTLGLLRGETVMSQKGQKTATGWEGWLPDKAESIPLLYKAMGGRPGAMTRAAVANLASLKAKDRRGHVLSNQMFERMTPFLPNEWDPEDLARSKTEQFIREYSQTLSNRVNSLSTAGRQVPQALRSLISNRVKGALDTAGGAPADQNLAPEDMAALDRIYGQSADLSDPRQ